MDTEQDRIESAVKNTEILRLPKQTLSTFGTTNIYYYLLTEPVYSELTKDVSETVVREGRVIAERPKIVTPYYLSQLEGFSPEARKYFDMLVKARSFDALGVFYTYRNEPKKLSIIADRWLSVVDKLNGEIDERGDPLVSIIKGQDELWDVSLMKFIYEMTRNSLKSNLLQLEARGLLEVDSRGVPMDARVRIEEFFRKVSLGECDPQELKDELDRWNLFMEYEDRFLDIFRKRR